VKPDISLSRRIRMEPDGYYPTGYRMEPDIRYIPTTKRQILQNAKCYTVPVLKYTNWISIKIPPNTLKDLEAC